MNLGGEPERDDSGLPPVDIEVPDDARELDRDVQAYRRELRALRRQQRRMRLRGPLSHDGVVLPLLASCLVLALIAGTLLTVFTAGPGGDLPGSAARTTANATASGQRSSPVARKASSPAVAPGQAKPKLPDQAIKADGRLVRLQTLRSSVLALVPAACACTAMVRRLVGQATTAGVRIYLVGGGRLAAVPEVQAQAPRHAVVADDVSGVLGKSYPHTSLTALLVYSDGTLKVVSASSVLASQLRVLTAPPAQSTSPSATSPPASTSSAPDSSASATSASATSAPSASAPATSPSAG